MFSAKEKSGVRAWLPPRAVTAAPPTTEPTTLFRPGCACGGGCTRCQEKHLQPKLSVSSPHDPYEQEADRVADQVMRMPEPEVQRACACGGNCPKCKTKGPGHGLERLQTKDAGGGGAAQVSAPPIVNEVVQSSGDPLDSSALE